MDFQFFMKFYAEVGKQFKLRSAFFSRINAVSLKNCATYFILITPWNIGRF